MRPYQRIKLQVDRARRLGTTLPTDERGSQRAQTLEVLNALLAVQEQLTDIACDGEIQRDETSVDPRSNARTAAADAARYYYLDGAADQLSMTIRTLKCAMVLDDRPYGV